MTPGFWMGVVVAAVCFGVAYAAFVMTVSGRKKGWW